MTNYKDFPFTSNGVNFISRISLDSPMLNSIEKLPAVVFNQMNIDAVTEMIGNASLFTKDELEKELARVNEGGTHAFILLGENN